MPGVTALLFARLYAFIYVVFCTSGIYVTKTTTLAILAASYGNVAESTNDYVTFLFRIRLSWTGYVCKEILF